MSDFGESLIKGLESAIDGEGSREHHISEVRRIRTALRMGVPEFSKTFGLSKRTVEKWDAEERDPRGAASVLLKVIEKSPQAVIDALSDR